ncbi:MAG: VOC family protein, partial [Gammaproteobacteria bacterium]
AASVAFYEALDMTVRYGGKLARFTSLYAGSCYVNLVVDNQTEQRGFWGRVIFYVSSVDALYEQIVAAGYRTETRPTDASWGERYFHVRDPDNHELSFARLVTRKTQC